LKTLTPGMRRLLTAAAVLVFLAGVQLFVFPGRTARYFAWTINPPLTAAFLGASYWSSVGFELAAARERTWAQARIAAPAVFVFTVLTLVVTLVHIDRFHFGPRFEPATRAVTWIWLAIYSIVPVMMILLLAAQRREPGIDPPREASPPAWLVGLVALQAVVLLGVGAALLVSPLRAAVIWPWALTPLTGRAIGAWLCSLGVAAAHALREGDLARVRPAAVAYITFAVLQAIALMRFPHTLHWSQPQAIGYAAFLATTLAAGLGALTRRQVPR